jgi:hypothetical protein
VAVVGETEDGTALLMTPEEAARRRADTDDG